RPRRQRKRESEYYHYRGPGYPKFFFCRPYHQQWPCGGSMAGWQLWFHPGCSRARELNVGHSRVGGRTCTAAAACVITRLSRRHKEAHGEAVTATPAASATSPAGPERKQGKSADPSYTKLTAYIWKDTHQAVKIRLLQERQGREFSELVGLNKQGILARRMPLKSGSIDQYSSGRRMVVAERSASVLLQ